MENAAKLKNPENRVPQSKKERDRYRRIAEEYCRDKKIIPPVSMDELRECAQELSLREDMPRKYFDFLMVLLSNAVWRDTVAAIPFERRILLIPQCLRNTPECKGEFDQLGLLCGQCGKCDIDHIQKEAEKLGYVVLVAEGATVVARLIECGQVEAVIGVSCLATLEKTFPRISSHAIPGIAIPLLNDGCDRTEVDIDWLFDTIHLQSQDKEHSQLDLDNLRTKVNSWFSPEESSRLLVTEGGETEKISAEWVALSGKRWRPFLAAASYVSILSSYDPEEDLIKVAYAVECFHKASLVHDDIEDEDEERYGEQSLHMKHGIPVALNAGDFLVGEGYRLLAETGFTDERRRAMLQVASAGHRELCLGQGAELCWRKNPEPMSVDEILDIFRWKTAPAFRVALQVGAIAAGADGETLDTLAEFSRSLGVAYQIRDDLDDFFSDNPHQLSLARPSILLAVAYDCAGAPIRERICGYYKGEKGIDVHDICRSLLVEGKVRQLLEHYKNKAIRSLSPLRDANLKSLLYRINSRIFGSDSES